MGFLEIILMKTKLLINYIVDYVRIKIQNTPLYPDIVQLLYLYSPLFPKGCVAAHWCAVKF